jgi:hypothetical protein
VSPHLTKAATIQIVVTVGVVTLVFLAVSPSRLLGALGKVSLGHFAAMVGLAAGAHALGIVRWRLFVPHQPFRRLAGYYYAAVMLAAVLPGQVGGDAARMLGLGRAEARAMPATLSVIADRVVGLVAVLLVGTLGAYTSASVPTTLRATLVVSSSTLVAAALLLIVLGRRAAPARASDRGTALGTRIDQWRRDAALFVAGVTGARLVAGLALGLLFQLLSVLVSVVGARSLGIEVALADWCWIFAVVSIALVLPVTIGGWGVREGAFVVLLGRFGVPAELAVALSLVVFAAGLLPALPAGLYFLADPRLARP